MKAAFEKHEGETETQVERLEAVFKSIDESPKGKTCPAILGILDEGKEIMDEYKKMPALDAGLLAAAQAVEHYEISRYGTLKTWAAELGYTDAVNCSTRRCRKRRRPTRRFLRWPRAASTITRRWRKPPEYCVQPLMSIAMPAIVMAMPIMARASTRAPSITRASATANSG